MGGVGPGRWVAGVLLGHLARLESAGGDEAAVHGRRVASRRLRVACAVFGELGPARVQRCAKRLKGVGKALGGARTWDVHGLLLAELAGEAEEAVEAAALEHLGDRVARAGRRARARVRAPEVARAVRKAAVALRALAEGLPERLDPASLSAYAWSCLAPRAAAAFGPLARLRAAEDGPALHEARMALKELRYAVEWLEPAFPAGIGAWTDRLRALQEALGRHHDWALLETLLRDEAGRLEAQGHEALPRGLRRAADRAAARRTRAYDAFRSLAPEASAEALVRELQGSLGLSSGSASG